MNLNQNPFLNAVLAALYIVLIVSVISSFERFADRPDTIMAPIIMLSLFVLSASIMGFLFVARPIQLFLENQKHEAVKFFGKTVGTFALILAVLVVTLIIGA